VSGFAGSWLALREAADHRSRSPELARMLVQWLAPGRTLQVLDLGCGTGSNLRWLAPRLGARQRWRMIDLDPALLDAVPPAVRAWAAARGHPTVATRDGLRVADDLEIRCERADLSRGAPELGGSDLVTASALADLVSADWLRTLASGCARAGAAVLLALSYDGRIGFVPAVDGDSQLRDAVNRHQRRDKGFGPALGPGAAAAATATFAARGYRVVQVRSDWCLGPADAALQRALMQGWAGAAAEAGADPERIARWKRRRLRALDRDDARTRVGHVDLLALPRR
jgi:SAM-dependent methyltransferase